MVACRIGVATLLLLGGPAAPSAEPQRPPGDREPVLQLEAGGPTAAVTALAFSPDGKTLFVGGYDKVVRTWTRGPGGDFTAGAEYRVPIGPGMDGVINALALSPDGRWLAVAGSGVVREAAGFREPGIVMPGFGRFTPAMLEDQGTVFLFDRDGKGMQRLRGHRGQVLSMTFAPPRDGKPALLISVAREEEGRRYVGVLRLWDVTRGEELARSDGVNDPGDGRPGLAAYHTGKGARELAVGLACNEEPLQVWEAAGRRLRSAGARGAFNDTLALLPGSSPAGSGTLLRGTFRPGGAHLHGVKIEEGTRLEGDPERPPVLVARDAAPRALTLLPRGPGRRPDHAAVVLRFPDPNRDPDREAYRLAVVDVRPGAGFGEVWTNRFLWRGGRLPVLAASPDGRLLAVAGNPDHQVLVFGLADLLANRDEPPARIRSRGAVVRNVAFVRKGNDRGLLLDEQADGPGTLVLDLRRRSLGGDRAGWKRDAPAPDGWEVRVLGRAGGVNPPVEKATGVGFEVQGGGKVRGTVRLGPEQQPTRYALLPPGPKPRLDVPLLAVGYEARGVTYLALYDVSTGLRVRQFTGHVNPIRALAFDAAGRLLASAADDQTVCVWSLTDLDETLGRHGIIRGLAVGQRGGGLVVARLDTANLARANRAEVRRTGVQEDDVIEGLVVDRKLRRPESPHAFYEALWQLRPGATAVLRIRGKGDVALKVDQGTDDRKPLFSLFVTRAAKPEDRLWLGWNPNGPYDAGDPVRAERFIGWLRNPDRADAPVSFSLAGRYRREYHREGILKYLLERGSLAPALEDWKREKPPRPSTSLWIDELGPSPERRDPQGNPLVRERKLTLRASVHGIPLAKVASVRWQLDGGARRNFDQDLEREFTADLSSLPWERGLHEIRLVVTTVEADPAEYSELIRLRYLPPAPSVRFDPGWLKTQFGSQPPDRRQARAEDLVVRAEVSPGQTGPGAPRVKVRVRHGGQERVVDGLAVREKLRLKPGENHIEVRAENEGALPGLEDYEADAQSLVVHYIPERKVPPVLTLEAVTPAGGEAVSPRPGEYLVVRSPRVRVRGRITAEDDLTAATRDGAVLAGFRDAADRRDFRVNEELVLKPGKTELTFRARTAKAAAEPKRLLLEYHPEPPRLERDEPRSLVREADEPLDFRLEKRLTAPADPHPYEASVRANGSEVRAEVGADRKLRADVRLRRGKNLLEVVLKNRYETRTEEILVYCKRPPTGVRFEQPKVGDRPLLDLVARAQSPKDMPLTGARLNGRQMGPEVFREDGEEKGVKTWRAFVKDVPLEEGENTFRLSVGNADGECLEPATVKVLYRKPPPPRAVVQFIEPRTDLTVDVRRCPLAFRVVSASPLRRVEVTVNDRPLDGLARTEESGGVVYRTDGVPLEPGPNVLQVVAVNDGGASAPARRTVSYTRRTAVVRLDRLQRQDTKQFLDPGAMALVGNLWLHGRVEWPDEGDALLRKPVRVRVLVNDFEQFDTQLAEAVGRWRAFRAEVRLNREVNRVELQFPEGVKFEEQDRPVFSLLCARPAKEQRLHLVVIGPGQADPDPLVRRMLNALQANRVEGDQFRTPAFREGRVYPPLYGDVNREQVYAALIDVRHRIRATAGPLNDVVLVYFQGQEAVRAGRHYLLTEQSRKFGRLDRTALDCDTMRDLLSEVPGARLLLLDVADPAQAADRGRPGGNAFPHIGFYRYVWLGNQAVPADAQFLHALEVSLSRAGPLRDVKREVETSVTPVAQKYREKIGADIGLYLYNPSGLDELLLGVPRK